MLFRKKDNLDDSPVKFNRKSHKKRILEESDEETSDKETSDKEASGKNPNEKTSVEKESSNSAANKKSNEQNKNNNIKEDVADTKVPPKRKTGFLFAFVYNKIKKVDSIHETIFLLE